MRAFTTRATASVVVVLALTLLAACGGDGAEPLADVRDPAAPGPYAVGLTKMTFTRPATVGGAPREMLTWIWYPVRGAPTDDPVEDAEPSRNGAPFPVIIFSHGSGGRPDNQTFLLEHLASFGFVVAAMPHPGNTIADCSPCDFNNILASARERPDDVTFVLGEMMALRDDESNSLGPVIDVERTAIAGHSFGGWTAVFVAPEGRFDAVVALAPGQPETLLGQATKVTAPVLLMGGDEDVLVPEGSVRKLFDRLAPDVRSYVSMPEGRHLSFIDRCPGCTDALPEARGHELVRRYVTAFLMVKVRDDTRYEEFLASDPPDSEWVQP